MKDKKKIIITLLALMIIFSSMMQMAYAEREDEDEEHEEDGWDLSDDFDDSDYYIDTSANDQSDTSVAQAVPDSALDDYTKELLKLYNEQQDLLTQYSRRISDLESENRKLKEKITLLEKKPELSADYRDDDSDGVLNKDDLFPGENDYAMLDSDGDGVADYSDLYPGEDDLDHQDIDQDGVMDSQDSDLHKSTDKDHDGIDDAYDEKDDRPLFARIFEWIGIR